MKLRINDTVQVICGKSKGHTGKILKIWKKSNKVIVEGANIIKKHIKKQEGRPGEVIEKEASLHMSNVMVLCPKTKKPTRIKYEKTKTGEKIRIAKKSGEIIKKTTKKN